MRAYFERGPIKISETPKDCAAPKVSEAVGAANAARIMLYGSSKALVIGIDNYGSGWFQTNRPWPKLSMAVKDAAEVAAALAEQGFKVTLKKDLTSAELETTLRDFFLVEGADPDARLLIWFAGHGHTIAGEGYIVPADGPSPRPHDVEFRRKALSLRRFGEYMREARAKHVLAVFDSCFAGTVFNVARAAPPPAITYSTGLPVRQFVSSGEAEQVVSDDGTFRRLFVDALRGLEPAADANQDGYITGTELGQFLFDKVTNLSNQGQTPRYGKLNALGYDRGDFVFETRKLGAPVPLMPPVAPSAADPLPTISMQLLEAERLWSAVKDTTSIATLEAYIARYGGTFYGDLAKSRLAEVKAAHAATLRVAEDARAAKQPSPTPQPKPEQQAAATPTPPPAPPPVPQQPAQPTVAILPSAPPPPRQEQLRRQRYPIGGPCTGQGQLCDQEFLQEVRTQSHLDIRLLPVEWCSLVRIRVSVNGVLTRTSNWFGWQGPGHLTDSGVMTLGPVSSGTHMIGIRAEGRPGGCNEGRFVFWRGTIEVTTTD